MVIWEQLQRHKENLPTIVDKDESLTKYLFDGTNGDRMIKINADSIKQNR